MIVNSPDIIGQDRNSRILVEDLLCLAQIFHSLTL